MKAPITNKTTLKILAMPSTMTNREVADALGMELDNVKDTRRNHKVEYAKTPKNRGYKDKILSYPESVTLEYIAQEVGCSLRYVYSVRPKGKPRKK